MQFHIFESIQFFNLFLVSFGTVWKYLTLTGTVWAQFGSSKPDKSAKKIEITKINSIFS
jgi:hypothetical protein